MVSAGAGLLALAALLFVLFAGGSQAGPPTGAATVVPGDALAYLHVSTDPSRSAVRSALALGAKLPDYPLLAATLQTRAAQLASGGSTSDFAGQVRPWLGNEAGLALLNTQTAVSAPLIVLAVRDPAGARAFVARAGAQPAGAYDGVNVERYPGGDAVAFIRRYLIVGPDAGIREALDAATGRTQALANDQAYRAAAAGEPADRVIDAYVSAAGVRRLLLFHAGLRGALGVLLYQQAMNGVTVSVSIEHGGARIHIHTALDPTLLQLAGPGAPAFAPSLQNVIPAGSLLMLDARGLTRIAPRTLNAAAAIGIGGQVGPLLARLGSALASEGVNVSSILSIFAGETAVAVGPPGNAGQSSPLIIVTRVNDPQAVSTELAALQLPLENLFPTPSSGSGQAPLLGDRQVDGITAHQLVLATGLQLDYAVFNGLVVVSTGLDGIAEVAAHRRALAQDPGYASTLAGGPQEVTSLLFLNFSQLLSLGEQTGLVRSSSYRTVRADLAKIRAVGLQSARGEADTTAELFLQIP